MLVCIACRMHEDRFLGSNWNWKVALVIYIGKDSFEG